jgi:hypothetical protein
MDQTKLAVIEWYVNADSIEEISEKIDLLAAAYYRRVIRNAPRKVLIQRHFGNEHDQNLLFLAIHNLISENVKMFKRCKFHGDYITFVPSVKKKRDGNSGKFVPEKEVAA